MSFVVIQYGGRLFRIPKIPFETDEQAHDRAWYIALRFTQGVGVGYRQLKSEACQKINEKYYKMKYSDTIEK